MRGQTPDVVRVAIPCLVLVPLLTLSAAPSQALRGVGRFRAWNVLRLVTPLAWLAALLALKRAGDASVPTLAAAFVGATALASLASQWYGWRAFGGRAAPERDLVRPILAYGAPTMAAMIPHWLNQRLDQLVMIALLDARSLGLYVVAVAWSTAAHPLAMVVAHTAVPALAGTKDGWQRTRDVYRAGAAAAFVTTALLVAATPVLLPVVFGGEFRSAIPVAVVMALAGGVQGVNLVGAECLRGLGRPRAVLLAECVGLGVTVVALPVLVLLSGIVGAAAASLLSYTVVLLAQQRLMRTPRGEPSLTLAAPIPQELDPVA
jgi:O-antigen/teichoic acid export membrane protein